GFIFFLLGRPRAATSSLRQRTPPVQTSPGRPRRSLADSEELARKGRGRDLAPGGGGEGGRARDELVGALGEDALVDVDVVLQADAGVAAAADGELGHGQLVAADAGDGPGGAGGEAVAPLRGHRVGGARARGA